MPDQIAIVTCTFHCLASGSLELECALPNRSVTVKLKRAKAAEVLSQCPEVHRLHRVPVVISTGPGSKRAHFKRLFKAP